jgi:hypothetical protein
MKRYLSTMLFVLVFAGVAKAQAPEIRFVADTLVVDAQGMFESDPDLGTLTFDISSQDKDLKVAYDTAAQSAQRIVSLAEKTGLAKEDVTLGTLTLAPSYERDRKNRAKSYRVQGQVDLKVHDFSQIGPLLDGAVQEGIVEFRSLTYSLQDEEAAKEKAVAAAMRSAVGRESRRPAIGRGDPFGGRSGDLRADGHSRSEYGGNRARAAPDISHCHTGENSSERLGTMRVPNSVEATAHKLGASVGPAR